MHDRALGTLILGAKRRHAFGDAVRPTLEVLASHLAVSLSNARMVHKLETMATTDGLTGLLNKRAMLEAAAQKIAAAARFGPQALGARRPTSTSSRRSTTPTATTSATWSSAGSARSSSARSARPTSSRASAARSSSSSASRPTRRARCSSPSASARSSARRRFRTPSGALSVTCSIGVATFPEAGGDWETLFKAADEALYVSKRSGRNRCTAWRPQRKQAAGSR